MTSILDALQNAKVNLCEGKISFQIEIGKSQLKNAVTLLEKGYSLNESIDDLLELYPNVEDAPDKSENEDNDE